MRLFLSRLFSILYLLISANTVFADSHINRIISVDANATEILTSLGYSEQIIGADITSQPFFREPSPTNVGYHRSLNAEGLLALQPQLIIGSNHMGPNAVVAMINKANIPLIQLDSPHSPEELISNITTLGKALNAPKKASELIQRVNKTSNQIKALKRGTSPRIAFLLDVGDRGLSLAGKDTAANTLITIIGGKNVSEFNSYKSISMESLLSMNADIILIGQRNTTLITPEQILSNHPLLAHAEASKNNQLISIHSGSLIAGLSLAALDEAERISRRIYAQ